MASEKQMKRDYVVLGYFGAENFGDDLMLRGLVPLLRELRPASKVYVVSYYDRDIPIEQSEYVRIVRARTISEKLRKLVPLFAKHPVVFFGGGTPFTDTEGDGSYKFFRLARLLGSDFGYLGVGIGHLEKPERQQRARWLLRHCRAAMFRDRSSLQRAIALIGDADPGRFILGEDLAYLDVPRWKETRKTSVSSGELVLSWRDLDGEIGAERHDRLRRSLVHSLLTLCQENEFERLILLPLDASADLSVHCDLQRDLREAIPGVDVTMAEETGNSSALEILARAELALCVRLHGAFAGKNLGTPTVGFEYSPKVRYYFGSIGSRSLITWEQLESDSGCLIRAAELARSEAFRLPDSSTALRIVRQGVVDFLEAFECR